MSPNQVIRPAFAGRPPAPAPTNTVLFTLPDWLTSEQRTGIVAGLNCTYSAALCQAQRTRKLEAVTR